MLDAATRKQLKEVVSTYLTEKGIDPNDYHLGIGVTIRGFLVAVYPKQRISSSTPRIGRVLYRGPRDAYPGLEDMEEAMMLWVSPRFRKIHEIPLFTSP